MSATPTSDARGAAPRDLERRFLALAEKARVAAASPLQPDWSLQPKRTRWPSEKAVIEAMSKFHHGELATARICEKLHDSLSSPAARRFLTTQIADERRHAEFYARYIGVRGGRAPDPDDLAPIYAAAFDWEGPPEALILAVHVMLEGESLRLQQSLECWLPCPLFADLSRCIAHDEARHLAFGRLYLRQALPRLRLEEHRRIFLWLKGLWSRAVLRVATGLTPPGYFARHGGREAWLRKVWAERRGEIEALGLLSGEERPRICSP